VARLDAQRHAEPSAPGEPYRRARPARQRTRLAGESARHLCRDRRRRRADGRSATDPGRHVQARGGRLRTRKLTPLPVEATSHAWLWRPSVSGRWILYGRIDYALRSYAIAVADRTTWATRTLAVVDGHAAYAAPGQINGRYAVWIGCPDNHCRAYRYDLVTGRRIAMPLLGGYAYGQFGPSVTRDGTVYYGNARGCADVRLVRWRAGVAKTILRFPPNTAFQYSYADGKTVYCDQVGCDRDDLSGIYRIVDR
jgi:hypothetical protein